MPAKKKAKKKEPKIEEPKKKEAPKVSEAEEEEVIEVKTAKKEEPAEDESKVKEAPIDTKKPEISSFSQLDSDTSPDLEAKKEPEKEAPKEEVSEEEKEEPAEDGETESEQEETSTEEAKKWLKGVSPEIEAEAAGEKGSKKKTIIVIVIVALILGVIAGGFYYYRSKVAGKAGEEVKPTQAPPQATTAPTPTVTEDEEVDLSQYSISVLNGSGVAGEAGAVEELLTDSGFTEIDTGNAESYNYQQTEVSMKEDTPSSVYTAIEESLGDTYDVSKSDTPLDEDSTYDVTIIAGSKK